MILKLNFQNSKMGNDIEIELSNLKDGSTCQLYLHTFITVNFNF